MQDAVNNNRGTLTPTEPEPDLEGKAIQYRRGYVYADKTGPDDRWGLALSGGGIRSATFCLGVLQALAKAKFNLPGETGPAPQPPEPGRKPWPLLARFDFLSTVSGGGYAGGFLSALLRRSDASVAPDPAALAAAAYDALATDPPGRLSKVPTTIAKTSDRPLRWLRENGRYLAPNNTGDFFYDIAIAIRNLCAVHYVIGITLLTTFVLMFAMRLGSLYVPVDWIHQLAAALECMMQPPLPMDHGDIWFSPWFGVLVIWIVLTVIPCGIAYWLDQDKPSFTIELCKRVVPITGPFLGALFLWLVGLGTCLYIWSKVGMAVTDQASLFSRVPVPVLVLALGEVILLLALLAFGIAKYKDFLHKDLLLPRLFRARITRWLSAAMTGSMIIGLLALVETAGQTLYLWLATSEPTRLTLFSLVGGVTAIVAVVRQFAPMLAQPGKDGLLSKLPLNTILGVVGLTLTFALATVWNCAAIALLFGMQPPSADSIELLIEAMFSVSRFGQDAAGLWHVFYPVASAIFCALAVIAAGYFLGFVNLSSLQTMYSARLTRAYLGASNSARFAGQQKLDVTEADKDDDFKRDVYYQNNHLGPVHIINVTINATTGTGDQLTQRDRQGIPMAVTPAGIAVDGERWDPVSGLARQVAEGEAKRKLQIESVNATGPSGMTGRWLQFKAKVVSSLKAARTTWRSKKFTGPASELSIGQWIGISGAAFSTGLGRGTSLGQAMLFTITNIRLGWWWNSGTKDSTAPFKLWQNQTYLLRELRARFLGTDGSHWYLSDGGHFENTGVFELLRRRAAFVVCCDCGADPEYTFEDMANLMRLARIDFGAEFECIGPGRSSLFTPPEKLEKPGEPPAKDHPLAPYFAGKESDLRPAKETSETDEKCALLYRVTYSEAPKNGQAAETILLVLKPRLIKGAPLDLFEYQSKNKAFPQQTTFDQFFNEAQWESYRKLGVLIGSRIFS